MTAVQHFTACALDWLLEVQHDVDHATDGVASSIQDEDRAGCYRAVLEKLPLR